jgi:hypothetical protein
VTTTPQPIQLQRKFVTGSFRRDPKDRHEAWVHNALRHIHVRNLCYLGTSHHDVAFFGSWSFKPIG